MRKLHMRTVEAKSGSHWCTYPEVLPLGNNSMDLSLYLMHWSGIFSCSDRDPTQIRLKVKENVMAQLIVQSKGWVGLGGVTIHSGLLEPVPICASCPDLSITSSPFYLPGLGHKIYDNCCDHLLAVKEFTRHKGIEIRKFIQEKKHWQRSHWGQSLDRADNCSDL